MLCDFPVSTMSLKNSFLSDPKKKEMDQANNDDFKEPL